jgi:3',5'-cyclic AMP phosphodiesterase CpdA
LAHILLLKVGDVLKGVNRMKIFFLAAILLILTILPIFGDTISIYKYDDQSSMWLLVNQIEIASAQATGNFTTAMAPGNVGGFIPISVWKSQYGRIEMSVEISQSVSARISFSPYLGAIVNGKWVTDDLYVGLKSNDTLNFNYSVSSDTYHHLNVGNPSMPSKWERSSNVNFQRIKVTSGNNELYLWLGFNTEGTGIFVGPVIVDTYVVPDI